LRRNILKTFITLLVLAAATVGAGYIWHSTNGNPGKFFYNWFFVFNTTFMGRFIEFLAGMLLAGFFTGILQKPVIALKKYNTLMGAIMMIACIFLISLFEKDVYTHGTDTPVGLFIRNILFPFVTIIFFYGLIVEKTWLQKFLSLKWMLLLGNASYIFYLIHISYGYSVLEKWKMFPDRNFILLWAASIVLYLLVEKPSYSFLKKMIRKQESKKALKISKPVLINLLMFGWRRR
jgi:peptidoglycan/LPS O-acetylase OafA/YrhL